MSEPIAIVGIGGLFPGSPALDDFWSNIEAGKDTAREVPPDRWVLEPERAYHPQKGKADRVYSRRACLLADFELDPQGLDIDSETCARLDPMVRLALRAGRDAWQDAVTAPIDPRRVGVILGNIALPTESNSAMTDWVSGRRFEQQLFAKAGIPRPPETRQPVAEINRWVTGLPAGILARALGLGGGCYTLDAACASSLFALKLATDELLAGRADAMLSGGLSRPDCLYTQMGFSQLLALSPSGRCSPFDHKGDGLVVGEGAGIAVLKRLSDALHCGDHIYALIRGIGLSNDVEGNLLAPAKDGQLRAMRAAYARAGWEPGDVDLVECHATGTPVGDAVEYQSLTALWSLAEQDKQAEQCLNGNPKFCFGNERSEFPKHRNSEVSGIPSSFPKQPEKKKCVIGSVKSNVGHLLTGAGAAGLLKTLLALKHNTLPPTANFERPPAGFDFETGPFRVLAKAEPWPRGDRPRRAAVSGFGFGGTNAHVLLEEFSSQNTAEASFSFSKPQSSPAAPPLSELKKGPPLSGLKKAKRIAIVGMAASVGPWKELRAFQHRVLGGGKGEEPAPKRNAGAGEQKGWFIEELKIAVGAFRIPPKEIEEALPQQLLMLQAARQAFADARFGDVDRLRTGVFIGVSLDLNTSNYHLRWIIRQRAPEWAKALKLGLEGEALERWTDELCDDAGPALNANRTMGGLASIAASRIAREFGIGGPCYVLSSEESSGLSALDAAVRALQNGELECALVGAVDFPGDARALWAADLAKPQTDNIIRPFDRAADGSLPGEGAAAVVLKREADARRDGDRIYAFIRGIGSAAGGAADALEPTAAACVAAMQRAYADAGTDPASVGYVEAHGSGCPPEDRVEAEALQRFFPKGKHMAIGSAKADTGHAGAAAAMVSLVKASLCLYQEILPPLPVHPRKSLDGFLLPKAAQYWLHDAAAGPRRAGVSAMSTAGGYAHAVLEACPDTAREEERRHPLGPAGEGLFAIEADDETGLLRGLAQLAATAEAAGAMPIDALAHNWQCETGQHADAKLGLALIARNAQELIRLIGLADKKLKKKSADDGGGRIFFSLTPFGQGQKVAFVYPGSGSQYPGMGRGLSVHWPEVFRKQKAEYLRSQLMPELIWNAAAPAFASEARALILAQVALGITVSDLMRGFGVQPCAVIGYSLGETAGLFSLGAWHERDEMLRRVMASDLFTTELTGPCNAARRAWGENAENIRWSLGVVDKPAAQVRKIVAEIPQVYLLIVNAPEECVIGGEREAVKKAAARLNARFVPLQGVTTVHCDVVKQVETAYRELHLLTTTPPEGVRFYSGAWGKSYAVTRESAAASITDQALSGVDFPRVIKQAWEDGVRIFVEIGPGRSCTRMISQILQDKSFAAGAVCTDGQDAVLSVLRVLAMLISERAVSAGAFSTGAKTEEAIKETNIVIPVRGREFFNIRVTAPTEGGSSGSHAPARRPSASQAAKAHRNMGTKKFTGTRTETREKTSSFFSPRGIVRMTQAGADAHAAFLRVFEQAANAFAQQTGFQMGLLEKLPSFGDGVTLRNFRKDEKISEEKIEGQSRALEGVPIRSGNQNSENAPMPDESGIAAVQDVQAMSKKIAAVQDVRAMSKKMCMEFAVGSIAKTLGAEFAQVDTHPTRVRLPDEPLMLADRILDIQGEARSMGSGKVITEHDVLEGAWYLDSGRIPTCIAVEAGQADLFLSGYLGIDFETKGLAVYRLLDAVVTFHAELPRPGTVIHYAIEIQHFFKQGDTWLFRFRFDATVDGRLFLTMREGCAGFFSQAALDAGQGIVKSRLDKRTLSGTLPKDWQTLVPMAVESIDEGRLEALRDGDLATAFGAAFAGLPLQRPLTIPGGRMRLVHRVMQIEPHGGRFNIGFIRAEADIRPDDWFLTCHFVDDKVMPGTLMYECCMHTLRILLLRMGWTGETHETVCEPVPGVKSRLKCRGQVLDTTRTVTYEITLKELGYDPVPFAIADALMYADGKPIVEISDMSLRMSGLSRKILQKTWNSSRKEEKDKETGPGIKAAVYDSARIIAFCNGKPSEAFGAPYRIFDEERRIARLPRAPYQFLDRITAVEGEAFVMKAGAACEAQYDMRADAWYFGSNRQAHIPFSILLEIALQPCGWLAAYVGSALTSKTDLSFRNLGGDAVLHAPVIQADEVLTVRASLTEVSSSAGMIIQNFSFLILGQGRGKVYEGTTNFGFFTREALAKQVGVRNAKSYLSEALPAESERTLFPREAPFPDARMRMVEHIDVYMPEGGPDGLGLIRGSIDVDPAAWFFEAHFYQDPVWPGSLGLEGFLQLLKAVAARRWNTGPDTSFLTCPPDTRHHWIYRGQVIRSCKRVEIEAVITTADDERRHLTADGFLMADGRIIYEMKDFSLSIALNS